MKNTFKTVISFILTHEYGIYVALCVGCLLAFGHVYYHSTYDHAASEQKFLRDVIPGKPIGALNILYPRLFNIEYKVADLPAFASIRAIPDDVATSASDATKFVIYRTTGPRTYYVLLNVYDMIVDCRQGDRNAK